MKPLLTTLTSICLLLLGACKNTTAPDATPEAKTTTASNFTYSPAKQYKDYWYNGTAEISSYALSQARYGEIREGEAVLVFVTEPFSTTYNTKADSPTPDDPSVLKLNQTRNFTTGIYPYSLMNSSFFPVENGEQSLKVSTSVQEWCGHVYMELQNKAQFNVRIDSYFQGESIADLTLDKVDLEDDIFSKIRLQPELLKQGELTIIPSFFYLRLKHVKTKSYKANAKLIEQEDGNSMYTLTYPELGRKFTVTFKTDFPHTIESWTESYSSGFGANAKQIQTTATKIKTIRSDYWRRNANADMVLRDSLGLK